MRGRGATLALVIAMAVAGCSSSGGDQGRTVVGHWSFVVPSSWKESTPSDSTSWKKAYDVNGTHVEFNDSMGDYASTSMAINTMGLAASTRLSGYRTEDPQDLSIPKASEARELSFTFTDGGQQRAGRWIVADEKGDHPVTAAVSISSDSATIDQSVVDDLMNTLRWEN